jgi:hypothetical protein
LQEDATQSDRFAVATEQTRIDPEVLWDKQMPPGSIHLNNPFAGKFRATKVQTPQPFSLPGTEYWQVSIHFPRLSRVPFLFKTLTFPHYKEATQGFKQRSTASLLVGCLQRCKWQH